MNIFITESQKERKKRESHNAESCDLDIKYSSGSTQGPKPNCRSLLKDIFFFVFLLLAT